MPRRKSKADATVCFNVTLSGKLARRLDAEFARAQEAAPYAFISRSALIAHALGEWCAILDNPAREPSLPKPARVRVRPNRAKRNRRLLTPEKVRQIRKDRRPAVEVARDLGIHRATVGRVRSGQSGASVT